MKVTTKLLGATALMAASATAANAVELEVMHWWTSGGEAAAVAEFAKAFDATGNHWVDAAFAGPGATPAVQTASMKTATRTRLRDGRARTLSIAVSWFVCVHPGNSNARNVRAVVLLSVKRAPSGDDDGAGCGARRRPRRFQAHKRP